MVSLYAPLRLSKSHVIIDPRKIKKTATSTRVPITNNIDFTAGTASDRVGKNKISTAKPWI
jgi:hypothetical protein